jgi:hypothetical protein
VSPTRPARPRAGSAQPTAQRDTTGTTKGGLTIALDEDCHSRQRRHRHHGGVLPRQDGHEVTVVDRQPGPARETSFANAGEISPGYSAPWAGPGVPLKAIKWLLMHHSPLVIKPMLDAAMWRWG